MRLQEVLTGATCPTERSYRKVEQDIIAYDQDSEVMPVKTEQIHK